MRKPRDKRNIIFAISVIAIGVLLFARNTTSYAASMVSPPPLLAGPSGSWGTPKMPHFVLGVTGLSGSDYPSSFISTLTHQYHITAFRMDNNLFNGKAGDQLQKYLSNGATFVYASYSSGSASGLVSLIQSNPQISMVGLSNEPNGCGYGQACDSPQQYAQMLIADHDALEHAGIQTPLCAFEVAGDAGTDGSNPQAFISQVIQDGGAGHFEYACLHIYPKQNQPSWSAELQELSTNLDEVESIVKVPIFITEANIASGGSPGNAPVAGSYSYSTSPTQAMQSLIQTYESKPYVKGVFWYDLSDSSWIFPLFSADLQPTSMAQAFSTVISTHR